MAELEKLTVTIETNVDTSGIDELKAQLKDLQSLQKKWTSTATNGNSVAENLFGSDATRQVENLKNEIALLEKEIASMSTGNVKGLSTSLKELTSSFSKGALSGVGSAVKKIALALVGVRGTFTAIRKAMSSYLAQNEELQAQLNGCWYALGSLMAPALEFIVDLFSKIVGYVNVLVKALGGAGVNMSNFGKSAAKASKKLAGFDEINNIGSDSSGGASGMSFAGMQLDPSITAALEKIGNWIKEHLPLVIAIGAAFALWKISTLLPESLAGIAGVLGKIAGVVMLIGGAIIYVQSFVDAMKNGVDWANLTGMVAGTALAFAGLFLLFGMSAAPIALLVGGIGILVAGLYDFITTGTMTTEACAAICIGLIAIGAAISLLTGSWIPIVVAAVVALATVVYKNWDKIKETLGKAWSWIKESVINPIIGGINGLLKAVENGINHVIDMLNTLSWDIPDWVPLLGGKHFGFSIGRVSVPQIPMLAEGGLAYGQTMAMVGDNFNASNDPEVIAPLSKLQNMLGGADAEELTLLARINDTLEQINSKNFDITLDGDSMADKLNTITEQKQRRRGSNAFAIAR